ncbi:mechanosensitive ion channel family protein [Thermovibrio sp.]
MYQLNSLKELLPLALYLLTIILTLLAEKLTEKLILKKFKEKLLIDAAVIVLFSLILFGIGWELSFLYEKWNLRETLRNLTIFITAIYLTRATYTISQKKGKVKLIAITFFTFAFLASILFIFYPFKNEKLLEWLIYLKKFFIYLGSMAVFWELSYAFKSTTLSKGFRITSFLVITTLFSLWELNYLNFNFKTLIGIAILVGITSLYSLSYTKFFPQFVRKALKELPEKDLKIVEKNGKVLLSVLYLILVIKILEVFSNLSKIVELIDNFYLIKTDLVKISVGNIVDFILTAVILFSLLNIGKKLVKLTFPIERREVEGGSAEALIFNLGVLFNSIILLSTLGITWKVILPIAGTLGVGLGFGLQTIMNNYVSGFILLFSKKLKVGDIVELPSISVSTLGSTQPSVFGKVEDIGILSTIVKTNDGVEISIPNSNFISSPIVNFSLKDPFVRLKIPIGVAYSSDPLEVKRILEEVIKELPYTVRFLPTNVRFEELGDSALIFKAIFWIDIRKDLWVRNVVSDFYYKAWYKLKEAGIEIPFPQNDIWFRNSLKVEIERGGKVDKSNS